MKRNLAISLGLAFAAIAAVAYSQQASGQSDGWVTLFDGKNLDNWN